MVTIEASGIAPALYAAEALDVPMIFAKKAKNITMNEGILTAEVYSFTKQVTSTVSIASKFLTPEDKVLIVDDFLANGQAAKGLIQIIEEAGAHVEAVGIVIEKSFQDGRALLEEAGYPVVSLARLDRFENGRMKSEGINTVIVGKPNAGKSSLMNILLDEDRAIVTDIAGTTRDALQESVRLGGLMLNLIDTAGIHNTEDTVEKIGVDRAKQDIEQADFILFVVDGSEEWSDEDEQILPLIAQKKGIILLNKADLKAKVSELFLKDKLSWDTIAFSNETKQGLQQLEQYITDKFERGDLQFNDQICLTSIRHKNAVMQAVNALHRVEQSIKDGMPEDFFTIDLMEAYQQLGLINGDTATEDLVNKIFEEFCMGK